VTLIYPCEFGTPLHIDLLTDLGPRVEAEAITFFSAAPIEWRIAPDDWRPGLLQNVHSSMRTFHGLQRCVTRNGSLETRGLLVSNCTLETRGIGAAIVHVHIRIGTYPEAGFCSSAREAEGKRIIMPTPASPVPTTQHIHAVA
jgi:hypothetical protein